MDKLKAWYREHKIEIVNGSKLGFYFTIIISIPFIAIIFALLNGTDKTLPSQGLFTGIIAYCGIIISFWGIYWKTTREEEKVKKEKEERRLHQIQNINSYIKYIVDKNFEYFHDDNDEGISVDNFIRKMLEIKKNSENNMSTLMYCFDEGYISDNLENILKLEYGIKVLTLERELSDIKNNNLVRLSEFHPNKLRSMILNVAIKNKGTQETHLSFLISFFDTISFILKYPNYEIENKNNIDKLINYLPNLNLEVTKNNRCLKFLENLKDNYEEHNSILALLNIYTVNMLNLEIIANEIIPWKINVNEEIYALNQEIQNEIVYLRKTVESSQIILRLLLDIENELIGKQQDS